MLGPFKWILILLLLILKILSCLFMPPSPSNLLNSSSVKINDENDGNIETSFDQDLAVNQEYGDQAVAVSQDYEAILF